MDEEIMMGSCPAPLNLESTQKWISVNDNLPLWGSEAKGDWGGNYLCIVEREIDPNSLCFEEGGISRTVELCYFNNGTNLFQDKNSDWVKATHWTQIAQLPFHQSTLISRVDMKSRIESGELHMIYHMKETDEFYQTSRELALSSVSYDEPLFYSSTRSSEHIEDYMYAVLKNRPQFKIY